MSTLPPISSTANVPDYVKQLQTIYGLPNQTAFGSAVFFEPLKANDSLEIAALAQYKYFVGKLWEKYGEAAWLGTWKLVYRRKPGNKIGILAELSALKGPTIGGSADLILHEVEQADRGRVALSAAYDTPETSDLTLFEIGDGQAMSGLMIAGQRISGETTFLIILMD